MSFIRGADWAHIQHSPRSCERFHTSVFGEYGTEIARALPMQTVSWFAVIVKPRHEKSAAAGLRSKGFNEFLPLYSSRRRWSDRVQQVELPLFPGYVFCQFSTDQRTGVLRTGGVVGVVGFGTGPAQVEESQIEAIRTILRSGYPVQPWPYLHVGDGVRIEDGPLIGLEGVLLREKGERRVVVSVELLQRSVAVDIGRESVGLLNSPAAALFAAPMATSRS